MFVERRKHKRFEAREGGIVLLTPPWPDTSVVGYISHISKGGVEFHYYGDEKLPDTPLQLQILANGVSHVLHIPFKAVWDFPILNESPAARRIRGCGVQFRELTHDQMFLLDYFIENHTIGEADISHPKSPLSEIGSLC
jgi:hypothetical protein